MPFISQYLNYNSCVTKQSKLKKNNDVCLDGNLRSDICDQSVTGQDRKWVWMNCRSQSIRTTCWSWTTVLIISVVLAQLFVCPSSATACKQSGFPSGLCNCLSEGWSFRSCASQFHKRSDPMLDNYPTQQQQQHNQQQQQQQQQSQYLQLTDPLSTSPFLPKRHFDPFKLPNKRFTPNNSNKQWENLFMQPAARSFDFQNEYQPQIRDVPSQYNYY